MRAPSRNCGSAACTSASGATTFDLVDASQLGERIARELRLGARPEDGGVVDEQVDRVTGGPDEAAAVPVVADVARERDDLGQLRERLRGAAELLRPAGVDHQPPAVGGERAGEGEAEAP